MSNKAKILQEYREFNAPVRRALREMRKAFLLREDQKLTHTAKEKRKRK
jgi:hypothetical protein